MRLPLRIRITRLWLDVVCAARGHRRIYVCVRPACWYCTRCGRGHHDTTEGAE